MGILTLTHSLCHIHTHTHTYIHTHTLTHTHSLTRSLAHSHTHSLTHTLAHSHILTHTLAHSHILTHTHTHSINQSINQSINHTFKNSHSQHASSSSLPRLLNLYFLILMEPKDTIAAGRTALIVICSVFGTAALVLLLITHCLQPMRAKPIPWRT